MALWIAEALSLKNIIFGVGVTPLGGTIPAAGVPGGFSANYSLLSTLV